MPTLTSTTLGRFCRELAGGLDDIDTLLGEWQLNQIQFDALQRTPAFQQEMVRVQQEMQDIGNDAGYVYRMKSLSESLLPDVVQLLRDAATGPALKFEMIKWVAEMARLKEKPVPKGDVAGPRGPMVVFKFGPGLPVQSVMINPEGDDIPILPAVERTFVSRETVDEPTMEWPV
jgi:hypothetical protein